MTSFKSIFVSGSKLELLRERICCFLDSTSNANLALLTKADVNKTFEATLMFCGDQLVGICGHRRSFIFRDIYLVVHHDFTCLGIGSNLLRIFILHSSYKVLFLSSYLSPTYSSALSLYKKYGFHIIARYNNSKVMMSNCTTKGITFFLSSSLPTFTTFTNPANNPSSY